MSAQLSAQDRKFDDEAQRFSDLKNLDLIIDYGGMTGFYTKTNIVRKNGKWYSRRQKIKYFEKDSISEISISEVAPDSIKLLIHRLLNPGPKIETSSFNLNRDSLVKYYRTSPIAGNKITEQKFLRRIDDSVSLQNSLMSLYYPRFRMAHEQGYKIIVRFNKGSDLIAFSKSGNSPYFLPWKQDGINNWDPDIARIFDYLCGYRSSELNRKIYLYKRLVNQISRFSLGN